MNVDFAVIRLGCGTDTKKADGGLRVRQYMTVSTVRK